MDLDKADELVQETLRQARERYGPPAAPDPALMARLRATLEANADAALLGPLAETTEASAGTGWQQLTVDDLLRVVGRLRAEERWLGGRPVRALKVGRVEVAFCRGHMAENAGFAGVSRSAGIHLYGIPCYEVARGTYLEVIYRDEAPTLAVLNDRLMAEPAAVWGPVRGPVRSGVLEDDASGRASTGAD